MPVDIKLTQLYVSDYKKTFVLLIIWLIYFCTSYLPDMMKTNLVTVII